MNERRPGNACLKYEIYLMAFQLEVMRLVESDHLHLWVKQQLNLALCSGSQKALSLFGGDKIGHFSS